MKKKKKNPFMIVVIVLFGAYLSLYYLSISGYYEYKEYNKMVLTEEAMQRFENDVKDGKDISIENYISDYKDYSNSVSNFGLKTGESLEKIVDKGLGGIFRVLSKLVTD